VTRPDRPRGLTDRNGIIYIRPHSHVKICHPRHSYVGRTGTVVRIDGRRVWIALPTGTIVSAGHRSVEVLD
jgi:hypothetical protein